MSFDTPADVPAFEFRLKDAANPATAKSFVAVCLQTKRFARNEKGSVVWSPTPGDWIPIARAAEFRTVIEDGEVISVTGDANTSDAFFSLWTFLNDRRWMLPRLNPDLPHDPPKPRPVAHEPYRAPVLGRRVQS